MASVMGWDLGGANLKLARIEAGRAVRVAQIPCPIRQDVSKFDAALEEALNLCPPARVARRHHDRRTVGRVREPRRGRRLSGRHDARTQPAARRCIYGGQVGLSRLPPRGRAGVRRRVGQLACERRAGRPNAARRTVDRRRHDHDRPGSAQGRSGGGAGLADGERLAESELVYTGVVRTPVMAVARTAPFKGRMQRIAAERFATMADVWRLLGELPDDADPYPTPDLAGKSVEASAARLARMLGRDANEAGLRAYRRSRAAFRRLPACRDRAGGPHASRARLARARRAGDRRRLRPLHRQAARRAASPSLSRFRRFDRLRARGTRHGGDRARRPSPSGCSPNANCTSQVDGKRGERLERSPLGAN